MLELEARRQLSQPGADPARINRALDKGKDILGARFGARYEALENARRVQAAGDSSADCKRADPEAFGPATAALPQVTALDALGTRLRQIAGEALMLSSRDLLAETMLDPGREATIQPRGLERLFYASARPPQPREPRRTTGLRALAGRLALPPGNATQ